jgi:glutaminase
MLKNWNIIEAHQDPMAAIDAYFQQCSIAVTCRDLAIMGATLANGGTNPVSAESCLDPKYVTSVLSVMGTSGMYNYAGEWVFRVGLPAKSGVGGGIIAVLPGRLAISVFSPPLDQLGNSVRGIAVCSDLSSNFDLHLFNAPTSTTPIRLVYNSSQVSSSRLRSPQEVDLLKQQGHRIHLYELQGNLTFPTAEVFIRKAVEQINDLNFLILDFKRVLGIDQSTCWLLGNLFEILTNGHNIDIVLTHIDSVTDFEAYLRHHYFDGVGGKIKTMVENDLAIEWCETQLISKELNLGQDEVCCSLREQQLCSGFTDEEIKYLEKYLEKRSYKTGEVIIRKGEVADEIFFLLKGETVVMMPLSAGKFKRLSTITHGMAFGEIPLVGLSTRIADIIASKNSECFALNLERFKQLSQEKPQIKEKFLTNLCRILFERLKKANEEIAFLCR